VRRKRWEGDDRASATATAVDTQPPRRLFGALKGKLQVTPAFFEPLPPDELAGWEE
jgi:hypothetical protein